MLKFKIITVGSLSEAYWKNACDEYKKRLSLSCKITETELKEARLPQNPSAAEIKNCLETEADKIVESIPKTCRVVALCIEGVHYTSEELAGVIDKAGNEGIPELCFIIGSSHGLSDRIKQRADIKMSMSALTFPHQLARVMLYEAIYRSCQIIKGTKYHK